MEFHIRDYSLYLDATMYGFDKPGELLFEVDWDGPVGNPDDPELWARQKAALLGEIEQLLREGRIPIVAVFVSQGS